MTLPNHDWHGLFSFLSSLPISVLRYLELEANKLYDRANKLYKAALLTRCYVQHFLSPYIDSEVYHKRHFIKIPFINKGIEFIDIYSIFKDNLVIPSIPNYFNNSETPIICYKYNKPIRSTIFNLNKVVNDIDIGSNTPASLDCQNSNYSYPFAGHVITGNLNVIPDARVCNIISKGPKYRFQSITTPDPGYQWESDKLTVRHHKREPRGQPFHLPVSYYKQCYSVFRKHLRFALNAGVF